FAVSGPRVETEHQMVGGLAAVGVQEGQGDCPIARTRLARGSDDPAIAAPRLDFSCARPHMYRQCARKRWRGTDAWIGRPCWCTSQGRSIKSCCYAMSIWSRTIVSAASSAKGASG